MYMQDKLINIQKSIKQIKETILLNTLKMLSARGLIKKDKVNNLYESIKDKLTDDLVYIINLDAGNKIVLKISNLKITTINKASGIIDFLSNYTDYQKIVVVKDINQKAYKQIVEYPNTELFWETELLHNLIDHDFIPEHIIMPIGFQPRIFDKENKYKDHEKIEDTYFISQKNCPQLKITDPVARYFNLSVGQYVKIIRPSINSGYSSSYRIVVYSPLSKLWDKN